MEVTYIKYRVKKAKRIITAGIAAAFVWILPVSAEAAVKETKIHFIALNNSTDAILLESNGHYGLVDSGEDWEYPDGTNARYPLRTGITKGIGYEQQVIHYLKSQGVKKLDFYIATHSHSDHIGSGDEILDAFPTDRLYIQQYDDSYIIKSDNPNLFDNQYVYDDIIDAADRNGTEIITDLDLEENAKYRSFTLGDMSLDLLNFERKRDENGQIIPVVDENNNSIVVKVTAFGRTALLTADVDSTEGNTGKIANQLIEELGDLPQYQVEENEEFELEEKYRDTDVSNNIDETQKNTGKRICIDLMKMSHHAMESNNTTYFLTSLNPKDVVITGYAKTFSKRQRADLPNTAVYATTKNFAAVIAEFHESGVETYYTKLTPEWMKIEEDLYYFDNNGRTFTDQGAHEIGGKVYCFDEKGAMEKENRWVLVDGNWKYWLTSGEFPKNSWLKTGNSTYYLDEEGNAVTGWVKIKEDWYYFNENAVMETDAWIEDYYVDGSGVWRPERMKSQWLSSEKGYWYCHSDGSYTISGWERINGEWYYFDEAGWMLTGWQQIGSDWYYLNSDGAMAADIWAGDCYVDASGVWQPERRKPQWISSGSDYWYCHSDGSYTIAGWEEIDGEWYYFDEAGWMLTGWQQIGGSYYYLNSDGTMAADTWVGNYYLKSDGRMAVSAWVQDGQYYVDESGLWTI